MLPKLLKSVCNKIQQQKINFEVIVVIFIWNGFIHLLRWYPKFFCQVIDCGLRLMFLDHLHKWLCTDVIDAKFPFLYDLFCDRITFRVHPSGVEYIEFAAGFRCYRIDSNKTGALFECLRSNCFDFFDFVTRFEWTILRSMFDDIFGSGTIQASNISEK